MKKGTETNDGIPILGLLGIAFIVLKLCGVINWSWLWVLAPFWGAFVVLVIIIAVMVAMSDR